jgi:acetoin utilization deacetylase AcuC-like enzyme
MAHPTTTAFALVWPPGHHAEPTLAMGFCYLSTAALAALYARDHATRADSNRPNRVVLIDIDHHSGNGSAAILANQSEILFVDQLYRSPYDETLKRYTDGDYDSATDSYIGSGREFPYTKEDTTLGATPHPTVAAPNIVSVVFEGPHKAQQIETRFSSEVIPRVLAFKPDIVLWSLGVDSAKGDPLGGLGLEPDSYYRIIKSVRTVLPEARQCGVLEGGYDLTIGPKCLKPALIALHERL